MSLRYYLPYGLRLMTHGRCFSTCSCTFPSCTSRSSTPSRSLSRSLSLTLSLSHSVALPLSFSLSHPTAFPHADQIVFFHCLGLCQTPDSGHLRCKSGESKIRGLNKDDLLSIGLQVDNNNKLTAFCQVDTTIKLTALPLQGKSWNPVDWVKDGCTKSRPHPPSTLNPQS